MIGIFPSAMASSQISLSFCCIVSRSMDNEFCETYSKDVAEFSQTFCAVHGFITFAVPFLAPFSHARTIEVLVKPKAVLVEIYASFLRLGQPKGEFLFLVKTLHIPPVRNIERSHTCPPRNDLLTNVIACPVSKSSDSLGTLHPTLRCVSVSPTGLRNS